ncbi:MAG: hypothetical protein HZA46_15305 [Planctomycetales bacterium]|nr:hypothetical protein [Planctomycetales bacterium]
MELDDLKQAWAAHGVVLERSLAINERLIRETLLRKVRFALVQCQVVRTLEVALGIAMIVAAMAVLTNHFADPRYLVVAGGLAVLAGYVTGLCAYSLQQTARIDYADPVTMLQKTVERIRLAEYRAFKWTLLLGIVAWLPMALILFEALTGFDALARVGLEWLAANVLFGFVCLGIGQALSRRYVERTDLNPLAHRLVESLSGRAVRSATQHLAELAQFERSE